MTNSEWMWFVQGDLRTGKFVIVQQDVQEVRMVAADPERFKEFYKQEAFTQKLLPATT